MIRIVLIPLIALAGGIIGCSQQSQSGSDSVSEYGSPSPRHVRVVWTEDPTSHAIISWTTMAPSTESRILYDTESRDGDPDSYQFSTDAERAGEITMTAMDYTEGVSPGWYHHGQLKDLSPSTRYYFVVESEGEVTEEYYFVTAHTDDRPFKILSGGDSRLGGERPRYAGRNPHVDRQRMNKMMAGLLEENPDILALAHGADWGTTADWRHLFWWFEDNELLKTSDNRLLPFIVSRGNHDASVGFQENFWLGEITDQVSFGYYYTSTIGNTALVTLNSEISVAGDQRVWLDRELDRLTSDPEGPQWLLAQYHRPAYPVAKDFDRHMFARIRNAWTPLFDQYHLDLVLESDGHVLKRTMPIRNFEPAEDGVVYIGEGGLGVPQRTPIEDLWFVEEPGFAASAHHVWQLEISPDSLQMRAIGIDHDVVDDHTIYPRNRH